MLLESNTTLITPLTRTVKLGPVGGGGRWKLSASLIWKNNPSISLSFYEEQNFFVALENQISKYSPTGLVPCCGSSTNPTPWSVSHIDLHGLPGSSSLVSISSSLLGEFDPLLPDDGSLSTMCARNDGIGGGGMSRIDGGGPRSTHSRPVPSIQVAAVARHRPDPIKFSVLMVITHFGLQHIRQNTRVIISVHLKSW